MSIDTPDFQRGVASAQILLAKESSPSTTVIVGIPPNAETIVVVFECNPSVAPGSAIAFGVVSSINYPGVSTRPIGNGVQWVTYYFDVTNVIDEELELQVNNMTGAHWYVYADTGVHVVGNYAPLVDTLGNQWIIPTIPGSGPGNHPPTELKNIGGDLGGNGTLLAAPGAGVRYRLFALNAGAYVAGSQAQFVDSISGGRLVSCSQYAPGVMNIPPQGYPLSANAALNVTVQGAGASLFYSAYYTIENI